MSIARSKLVAGAVIAVAGALAFALWPRSSSANVEELIRQKAVKMARAAEQKDLSYIMDQVSERFVSAEGWRKSELRGVLAGQLLRGNWLRVFPADLKVAVNSSTSATFSGKFIFGRSTATNLKDLVRDSAMSSYAIDAKLEKEGEDWKFVSASHREINPSEFL
ncbi:MAG TPA: hypothetical protein VKE49_09750 [Myxococcaceae bacterium]|nr:hypothetical protein [Myxococcaceae bacterium]